MSAFLQSRGKHAFRDNADSTPPKPIASKVLPATNAEVEVIVLGISAVLLLIASGVRDADF